MHCGGADVGGGGGGVAALPGGGGGGGGGPQAAARRHSPQPSLPLATHTSPPAEILVFPILKGADLDTISAKKVRLQLQQELGVDLLSRKEEIDQIIMADVDQVNSHSDEEQSEEEVPKGKDDSESEPESEGKGGDDDDYEPGAKKMARKPKASPKKRKTDDDDDSDEEWGKRKKVAVAKKGGGGGAAGGRGKKSAFTKSFKLSPELADVVGSDVMPRHEVVKKLWAVIKERELQDPANKQYAICDDQLMKVIGVKRFRTFGMMKHLKDHFLEAA